MQTWGLQTEEAMRAEDMSLGDFVQQILVQLNDNKLYFKDERPWHEFFYRFKTAPDQKGKPRFLKALFFDWNGPYPRSQELSEYLHGLHWTGCLSAPNSAYDSFTLKSDVREIWQNTEIEPELREFLNVAGDAARRELVVNAR
jgi:hypothetical protein